MLRFISRLLTCTRAHTYWQTRTHTEICIPVSGIKDKNNVADNIGVKKMMTVFQTHFNPNEYKYIHESKACERGRRMTARPWESCNAIPIDAVTVIRHIPSAVNHYIPFQSRTVCVCVCVCVVCVCVCHSVCVCVCACVCVCVLCVCVLWLCYYEAWYKLRIQEWFR